MHELSIAEGVIDAIVERVGSRSVTSVVLDVGRLSGVSAEALRFCFDVAADGTTVTGAHLEIHEPAGRAHCHACGADFDLPDLIPLCDCGSANVEVLAGAELRIVSVEVVR